MRIIRPSFLSSLPEHVQADALLDWHERAAIREYDGGQHRDEAEAEAAKETARRYREAVR